jgi:hypothetical protein
MNNKLWKEKRKQRDKKYKELWGGLVLETYIQLPL